MAKNISKLIAVFIFGIFGGIFADQILWPYFVERPLFYQYSLEPNPVYVTQKNEVVIRENAALTDAVEKTSKSVILVNSKTAGQVLEGAGIIVSSDGLAVTLAELVPQGAVFSFSWQGKPLSFQILKRDLKANLALVKFGEVNLPALAFAGSGDLKPGERVFLVGQEVNEGIIKSFDEEMIKTNILEAKSSRGSPLFNIEGELLGLSLIGEDGRVLALPVSQIRSFAGF